jgi:hypothetical protein
MDSYNVNRKVATFGDISNNIESEKEELKKVRRSTVPNTDDQQQHIGNGRYKFNKVTRKMDDLSPAEVQDKLDSIDELEETNELFNFNKKIKDKSLNLLKSEIDSSFKEVAVVNFDKTGGDKNNSREPSLKEVIGNIEQVISKWKIYMSR